MHPDLTHLPPFLQQSILQRAEQAVQQSPVTVTNFVCPRSPGGINDFYSEGDYWWPDPENPEGPYIRRDGQSNPGNFKHHRHAIISLNQTIGILCSAWLHDRNPRWTEAMERHLRAWFVDEHTRMSPNLQYAQAIKGICTGRSYGIIDTVHLVDICRSVYLLRKQNALDGVLAEQVTTWFAEYGSWIFTHPYGVKELYEINNHATCCVLQLASFAQLTGNSEVLDLCKTHYKERFLPDQMALDGSFPIELGRTKPYAYSLFNLDIMTQLCHVLSEEGPENFWQYTLPDGRGIRKGIEFLVPYVQDRSHWPYPQDIEAWDDWPIAHPFLYLGGHLYNQPSWLKLWEKLEHFPTHEEVVRNFPVKHIWLWR